MKKCLLFIFALSLSSITYAQSEAILVTGKVVAGSDRKAVEFATVMLADQATGSPIAGTTSDEEGLFQLETEATNFFIQVSFIGYNPQKIQEFEVIDGRIDLSTIYLSEDSQTLDEVVVRGEKSQTEFKLDKRVFNVGKDLSNTGASALEVLNNVPSVTVNIEGQVSLRGSAGVQILINGKPSVLASDQGNALGTITAEMIDRVEVITNPSAKYDAEGTSGIINIVMKKEEKKGINGSMTLNTGTPNNHSLGLSLNRRTERFNLFSQLGIGYRTFPEKTRSINEDRLTNTLIRGEGENDKNELFSNLILGADYHINKTSVLSLSGHFAYEGETENSDILFRYWDDQELLESEWRRIEATEATNPKWQYDLQFKKDFEGDEDHTLLFSALGNFFGKDQSSLFTNTLLQGSDPGSDQLTENDFREARYTFKLDYTKPFSELFSIETGAQYLITDATNDYVVGEDVNGEWVNDPAFSNVFEFTQGVIGVYGTAAVEGKKFGVKAGLRMEHTDLRTELINTSELNDRQYTNLFPTLHTSYKFNEKLSMQAGYSKRIYRPRLWSLNPFINIRNNFSIRTGNPNLLPEFTDSYEITSIFVGAGFSTNLGVYHRFTTDIIERIVSVSGNVSTARPINIGTEGTTGVEFNFKYSPKNWVSLNGDFNYNYFNRKGTYEGTSFDFNADRWTSRLMTKLKLPAQFDVELTGNYRSGYRTFQGFQSENVFLNFGLRKKILKGKAILNISVQDVFASSVYENETDQPSFYLYSRGQEGRFVTVGISYGFGKGEAMEFSGQKHF